MTSVSEKRFAWQDFPRFKMMSDKVGLKREKELCQSKLLF